MNSWLRVLTPSPSPTPSYNPSDVTQGPVGFFVIAGLMVLTGLIAISLMNRTSKLQARYQVREELAAEKAQLDAESADASTSPVATSAGGAGGHQRADDDAEGHGRPADEPGAEPRA